MKIQVLKIFSHSFTDVYENKLDWFRLAFAPLVIWALGIGLATGVYWYSGYSPEYHQLLASYPKDLTFTQNKAIIFSNGIQNMAIGSSLIYWPIIYFQDLLINNLQQIIIPEFKITIHTALATGITCITAFTTFVCIQINGYRYTILLEGGKHWWNLHLNRRFVKLVLYFFLICFLKGLLLAATIIPLAIYYAFTNNYENTYFTGFYLEIFSIIIGIYITTRFLLTSLLVAINTNHPLKTSWHLLKGNVLRLTSLYMLIILCSIFIVQALLMIFSLLIDTISLMDTFFGRMIVSLSYIFGSLMLYSVLIKANSLVYQTLTENKAL